MARMPSKSDVHAYSTYTMGCRCDVCRAANATYHRERRAKVTAGLIAVHKHNNAGYSNGCRCSDCWQGVLTYQRALRKRRKAE